MADRDNHLSNIAYFGMRRTLDGEGHFGATLVVDTNGIPLEFRCSVPVRPSPIQTALYGAQIIDHIAFNLCGQPLLESLRVKPAFCLVESESQFSLQEYVSIPVFYADRVASGSDSDSGDGADEGGAQYRRLLRSREPHEHDAGSGTETIHEGAEDCIYLQRPANFHPVVLRSYPDWSRSLQSFLPHLRRLSGSIDVVEPFERITVGCRLLCQEDERFK